MKPQETSWPAYTPFPNRLLDEVMPTLKDTEWRLLCVVVRQTQGWYAGTNQRKQQDWLTHNQLKKRTNRASAAVSAGLDNLVKRNLIQIRNEDGHLLLTPQERRQERGRLFYQLHPRVLAKNGIPSTGGQPSHSQIEIHKAKTTKENGTKDLPLTLFFSEIKKPNADSPELNRKAGDLADSSAAASFIAHYHELYRVHLGKEAIEVSVKDCQRLSEYISHFGSAELEHLLPVFFKSEISHIRRNDYSVGSLLDTVAILRILHPNLK